MKKYMIITLMSLVFALPAMDRFDEDEPKKPQSPRSNVQLPEEIKTVEMIKAAISSAANAIEAIKSIKRLTLTSKAQKNRIEGYIQGHIDQVCQWLNAKTENLARSLYLLEATKIITQDQAEKSKRAFGNKYTMAGEEDSRAWKAAVTDFFEKNDYTKINNLIEKGVNVNQKFLGFVVVYYLHDGGYFKMNNNGTQSYSTIENPVQKMQTFLKAPLIDLNLKFYPYSNESLLSVLAVAIRECMQETEYKKNNFEILKILLADPRVNLDKVNTKGDSALAWAEKLKSENEKQGRTELYERSNRVISMIQDAMNHRKAKTVVDAFVESLKPTETSKNK